MWLKFVRYGDKLYARTPQGEFQFGEHTGLNEWFLGRRIHHTDGDRQAAADGHRLTLHTNPDTFARGWSVAIAQHRNMTN